MSRGAVIRLAVRGVGGLLVASAFVGGCERKAMSKGTDAGECVDFELASNDLACGTVDDCTIVVTGTLCADDACGCMHPPVVANLTAAARFNVETATLPYAECGTYETCTGPAELLCLEAQCVACGAGPFPDCVDAGPPDDGG
jgi:hypothetical protein